LTAFTRKVLLLPDPISDREKTDRSDCSHHWNSQMIFWLLHSFQFFLA